MVELAQVLLEFGAPDRAGAKMMLIQAVEACRSRNRLDAIPFQLYNNIGVIALSLDQVDEVGVHSCMHQSAWFQ